MKTDRLWNNRAAFRPARMGRIIGLLVFFCLALPETGRAAWTLTLDGDGRTRWTEDGWQDPFLHRTGISLRRVFSDSRGDRIILFGLVEAEDNVSRTSIHEIYGQYKGPLGKWNVTAGRFSLPWGLLSSFSTSRLLYDMPHDSLLGMDADSGVKVSGLAGPLDYAVSLTQGYGPYRTYGDSGHGLGVARIGFSPGDTEEIVLGLSGAWGRSIRAHEHPGHRHHYSDRALERALAGADVTLYWGRWLARMEAAGGRVDNQSLVTGFAALDYALMPGLDVNLAVALERRGSIDEDTWFAGFTAYPPWFTLRGGYRYADHSASRHEILFQLYRQFSVAF